ncbi:MAG TPA: TIGR02147 family protein [Fibrobacteria bacterium]|nr:TIGR02147 family protein [Fibrobacteria bacterium]
MKPSPTAKSLAPDILRYSDGRAYLQDWWEWKKNVSPRTSFRSFAARAETSPSLLKDVLEGRRRLTSESAHKFGKAMGLGERDRKYLVALAAFTRARSAESRSDAFAELSRLRCQAFVKVLDPRQYAAWSSWHHMAIRELVGLAAFQEDPAWIASVLVPEIKTREAEKALDDLRKLGLLRRDSQGRLEASDPAISSEFEVPSMVIRHFNQQMIQLGLTAPDRLAPEVREVSGLTLGLSQECYEHLKERIRTFKQELMETVLADRHPASLVAQFNVQLFPLAQPGIHREGGLP